MFSVLLLLRTTTLKIEAVFITVINIFQWEFPFKFNLINVSFTVLNTKLYLRDCNEHITFFIVTNSRTELRTQVL